MLAMRILVRDRRQCASNAEERVMKKIGLVGCGAIAKDVLRAVDDGRLAVEVAGVSTRTEETAREFLSTLRAPVALLGLDELIEASDLVIELAGGHVVADVARRCFAAKTDV